MLRGLIKTAVAQAFETSGAGKLVNALSGTKYPPLVLGYHQVVSDFRTDGTNGITASGISREMLEEHLDWIGKRYDFVSLDQLQQHLEQQEPFDRPVASITFDDGYRDNYVNAFPILKRKGIPATVFVVTDLVDSLEPPLHDRLYLLLVIALKAWSSPRSELSDRMRRLDIIPSNPGKVMRGVPDPYFTMRAMLETLRYSEILRLVNSLEMDFVIEKSVSDKVQSLTWSMLAEMSANGFTIGSHTKSHSLLTFESARRVLEELRGSKEILESRLGVPIRHFAYPDGRFDIRVAQEVAASGYACAYTICRHQLPEYPRLTIPRKILWENSCVDSSGRFSSAMMECQVHWLFDRFNFSDWGHDIQPDRSPDPREIVAS